MHRQWLILILTVLVISSYAAVVPAQSKRPMTEEESVFTPSQETFAADDVTSGPAMSGGLSGTGGSGNMGSKPTTDAIIQYDPDTDSIVVITDEVTNQQIQHVIESLDKPVPQVLIKVLFLEVTHSDDLDLGVEGSFNWNQNPDGTFRDSLSTNFSAGIATGGGFYRFIDDDMQVTLRALAKIGKTNVLSRPSIMTRNNQQATITIGQEIPFIINSRVTDNGQTINTIRYDNIGIILQVTPRITADRMVQMDVAPEISNLTAETVPISDTVDARVIALRSAQTSVVVADGKTVVIGGLMQDNKTRSVQKVPWLGDIPVLGMLFRREIDNKTKTELLIFLTPYVVETAKQLDTLSVQEHNKSEVPQHEFTPKMQEKYLDNFGPGNTPWTAEH